MPPAARITDMHTCPMVNPGPVPHVGGPIVKGQPNVLTVSMPQARISDQCVCVGPPDIIVKGSVTVLCGGMPAARMGDNTAHGGVIVTGAPTVLIGSSSNGGGGGGGASSAMPGNVPFSAPNLQSKTMIAAYKEAKPFCAICESSGDTASRNNILASPSNPNNSQAGGGAASSTGGAIQKVSNQPKLAAFNDKVRGLVSKSPTLSGKLKKLEENGWKIEKGPKGKGSFARKDKKLIVIDSGSNDIQTVQTIAHETGHAGYAAAPYVSPEGKTRGEYIAANAKRHLDDEGEATLVNTEIRNEILGNGGPDIGIAGTQSKKYQAAYQSYLKHGDRKKARVEIGNIFAKGERPSTEPTLNYEQYYSKVYEKHWDTKIKPKKP